MCSVTRLSSNVSVQYHLVVVVVVLSRHAQMLEGN